MLYTNNSIDQARYPIFQNRRRIQTNAKDIQFFLDSDYDFKNQIWRSGFFKIQETHWAKLPDIDEYKYPILGNGSTSTCKYNANWNHNDDSKLMNQHKRRSTYVLQKFKSKRSPTSSLWRWFTRTGQSMHESNIQNKPFIIKQSRLSPKEKRIYYLQR